MKIYLALMIILTAASCKIDRKDRINRDKFTFKLAEDDHLFFRNVRQIYYDIMEVPQARWRAYRFSDRYQGKKRPMISPTIVIDWDKNEAYILIETNEELTEEPVLKILEENGKTNQKYEYTLKERGRENMLEFATKIYEGIIAENVFYIEVNGKYQKLFTDEDDKEAFRIPIGDYYRLTNIF